MANSIEPQFKTPLERAMYWAGAVFTDNLGGGRPSQHDLSDEIPDWRWLYLVG